MVIFICWFYVYETFHESSILCDDELWGLDFQLKEIEKLHDRIFL
jgi:hypothetical protein